MQYKDAATFTIEEIILKRLLCFSVFFLTYSTYIKFWNFIINDFHITRSAYYVKVITDPQAQGQMLSSHFSSILGSVQPAIEV